MSPSNARKTTGRKPAEATSRPRAKLVPRGLGPGPNFRVARKRLGTLALVTGLFIGAYAVILYAAFPIGRIGFPVGVSVSVLEFVVWALCRRTSLPDKQAFYWA